MKFFAVIFVALVALQTASAAPLLAPIWSIIPFQTSYGPAVQAGSIKNTALGNTVYGDALQEAFILNEAAFNTIYGDAVQEAPANAAIGNTVTGDSAQIGLINASGLNSVDGENTQSGLLNAQVLDSNGEYSCYGGLCVRLLSSGTPTDDGDGLVLDILNPDSPSIL